MKLISVFTKEASDLKTKQNETLIHSLKRKKNHECWEVEHLLFPGLAGRETLPPNHWAQAQEFNTAHGFWVLLRHSSPNKDREQLPR
jgi:hypothetical protein